MKKSIIRTAMVVLMLTSFLFLQGCSYQVQLSQRSLIQGIGIDYESGTYRATVQVTQVSNQEENVVTIIKGEGDSEMDELNAVTLFNGKKPLYSLSLIHILPVQFHPARMQFLQHRRDAIPIPVRKRKD